MSKNTEAERYVIQADNVDVYILLPLFSLICESTASFPVIFLVTILIKLCFLPVRQGFYLKTFPGGILKRSDYQEMESTVV